MKTIRVKMNGKKSFKIAARRMLSFIVALGMSVSMFPFEAGAAGLPAVAGEDTINIGIASDIHINRDDSASDKVRETLFRQSLKGFYTAADNHLDAVAIAGDIADNGYVDELKTARSILDAELASTTAFTAVMGNHEFYKYGWGASVDRNPGWKAEMQKDFTDNMRVPIEQDLNVKGIHVLSVSPENELDSYTARENFLRTHIEAAAQENPVNPIIIIAHKPVKYTVLSSGDGFEDSYTSYAADWSDSFLEFLKQYPQIIYFSGHAHDDLGGPDMIFQKDFTSVQDGAVCSEGASAGVLVSVDANKVVTINRMNFSTNTIYKAWTVDIPKVVESKENFKYRDTIKNINLTVGADASELHVNWFNKYYRTGKVQFARKSDMIDGAFSSSFNEVTAYDKGKVDYSTFYYNHALLTSLEENTEYVYRVGNENGWSAYYSFKTSDSDGAFNFLFAADPQIGSTDTATDAAGWRNTLDRALEAFPDARMLLSGGDHVDNAYSGSEYDGFFSPPQLTGLPLATVVGNHDISTIYSQHFAYSNVSAATSLKLTGENSGDYWFIRNNTLFLMLNSSVLDSQEHINFMQQAILNAQKTGREIKWKVAMFHYSIFSTAMHSDEEDIIKRREGLAPAFSDLQVDLVLMGHDHSYTRTYMMNGTTPITAGGVQNSTTDPEPGQVLYVTGSSSSGSKYYDLETINAPYAAVTHKNGTSSISNVEVSDSALTITTYNPTDMTVIDRFTINKTRASENDTLKPYLHVPTANTVILNEPFDRLADVSAVDNVDGDITDQIIVTGDVNTGITGTYLLTYSITDTAGNTKTAAREITVKKPADTTGSLYFGIDIKNGKLQNEAGSTVANSAYTKTIGGYAFENDSELNQTVLCGPEQGNLRIDGLNLKALDNQFTIETYIKIPSEVTSYNVFQFEDQSINLVGRPCEGYPGETYFGAGKTQVTEDADVYAMKKLPTDKWIHLLCTAREGEQTLYVNGEKFSSDSYTKLDISPTSKDVLVLGGDGGDRGGRIKFASFRIYTSFVNDAQAKEIYTDRTKLKTPLNPRWDAGIPGKAVWEGVENATGYTVQLYKDGMESGSAVTGITDTCCDFTPAITAEGVYTFKVTAVGKGTAYSNSDASSKSDAYFYTTSAGALKPSLSISNENKVVLNGAFDKLADVFAEDRIDGDITEQIAVTGDVDTSAEGEYILTYRVTNSAGIIAAATRRVVVKKSFYFGIDIKNGKLQNEKYFAVNDSAYFMTGEDADTLYTFEKDPEVNQNVLCGPEKENLIINKLNLKGLGNKFTVEAYIKIPGTLGAYDVFQFDGQNINLVGLPGETYFGAGRSSSSGDADVYTDKSLPVDQWIHVLCTAKEGVQTLYVNGEKFATDTYKELNISSVGYDELVLGGSTAGRSGLIKFACFRVYSDFITDEDAGKMYTDMTRLSVPETPAWDSTTPGRAAWEAVANAGSYTVQLYKDGQASGSPITNVKDTYYDFTPVITETGAYAFTVTAIGDGTVYISSDMSAMSGTYSYTAPAVRLSTPAAITWDGTVPGRAVWEAVANAGSYTVQLYKDGQASGSPITNVTDTYYDFTPVITETGAYTFTVTAIGDGTAYGNSDMSAMSGTYSYTAPEEVNNHPGDHSTSSGPVNTDNRANVTVNGKTLDVGASMTTANTNGQTVTTVTMDGGRLKRALESEKSGASIAIRITDASHAAACVLTGEMIKDMAEKEATLVVQSGLAVYTLPASEIDIDGISGQPVTGVSPADLRVMVKIAGPSRKMKAAVERAAEDGGLTIMVPAVEFTISCTYNGITVDVNRFSTYIERLITIPAGIDPAKITTSIVVNPDGTAYPVPTQVVIKDGVCYARVKSLTNSSYALVHHPVQFADAENHWAKNAILNMGERMVASGDKNGNYNPETPITRAGFAALIVRALGLPQGTGESSFGDVAAEAWYCGYIQTASEYGIIAGYGNGTFGPDDRITREQVMVMIAKSMKLTGLESQSGSQAYNLLEAWGDGSSVAGYAKVGVATCIQGGIVSGKGTGVIAPKDYCTRAEAIVMIERLLKKSGLIG